MKGEDTSLQSVKKGQRKGLESLLQSTLACVCLWLLSTFFELQDFLLAFSLFRTLASYALTPACKTALVKKLRTPAQNTYDVPVLVRTHKGVSRWD